MWFGCGREEKLLIFRAVQLFAASCSSSSNGLHFCNTMNCYKLSATYSSFGSLDPSLPASSCSGISFHSRGQVRHTFTVVHSSGKHQLRRLVVFIRKFAEINDL